MTQPQVVVTETLVPACLEWLGSRAHLVRCSYDSPDELRTRLANASGLVVGSYTQVDEPLLIQAPNLKVAGRAGVGLDNFNLDSCRRHGVTVVYTPDANTNAVAEYVVALILDAMRPRVTLSDGDDAAAFHRYRRERVGTQLDSLTLGILGFGRIGKRVGRLGHALGMDLVVNDLLPEATVRQNIEFPFRFVDRTTLFQNSDVLSIHVDGRRENKHLVDGPALAQLKRTCLLINTSRGMMIDAYALADWARVTATDGGRAVLDVHDPEPPPTDQPDTYPLYGLSNVRLLPHTASRTTQALTAMSWVVKDVWEVLEGRDPKYKAP